MEIIIAFCALIHFLWSWFQVYYHLNLYYCFHIAPYVTLIIILCNRDLKKRGKSDVCVQTDVEKFQTMKDVETITDNDACGDTGRVSFKTDFILTDVKKFQMTKKGATMMDNDVWGDTDTVSFKSANSVPPALGNYGETCVQPQITSFSKRSKDFFSEMKETNPFHGNINSKQNSQVLYEGENQEIFDTDPESIEVDIPELNEAFKSSPESIEVDVSEWIDAFESSEDSLSLRNNISPVYFANNRCFVNNAFELESRESFKGSISKIPSSFLDYLDEDQISVESMPVLRKNVVSLHLVSRSKIALRRNVKKFKTWMKFRLSVNNSPRYPKLY